MNKSILMSRIYCSLANEEMGCDASNRIEQKRAHQWSMDTSEQEQFSNKKQAIKSASNEPASGAANTSISLLGNTSSSQSALLGNCLFRPEPVRSSHFADKNVSLFVTGDLNMGNKGSVDQLEIDTSISLSTSPNVQNPLCLNTGFRKVKVTQVVSENHLSEFVGKSYNPGDKNKIISNIFHRTGNDKSLAPTYNTGDGSAITVDPAFCQAKRNYNFIPTGERCEKGKGNLMSIGPNYYKSHENFVATDSFYNKANEAFMSAGRTYYKGVKDATVASLGTVYGKGNSSILLMGQNHNKGNETTITFGGFQDNPAEIYPSSRLLSNQSSAQPSGALRQKDFVKYPSTNSVSACTKWTGSGPKNKEQKTTIKVPSNNFPSNVKILLSTGILDGVPVKYVSWSREFHCIVQGGITQPTNIWLPSYIIQVLNAYEFEHHAGCKTRHPNSHIYFENGKTIYAVVQELKSTPQDMLFETIENVTGSPVNQKNFLSWKASYQAATRELQRINGKDEVVVPS
ncbi:hypothetical protein Adt_13356 [Abeliophyllum distichum]|uniref:Tify domain-containing protein n=1 Tax=Abeliophyllum distichum TaxID=126358 RepID=A0ABD1TWK2_9LAMI